MDDTEQNSSDKMHVVTALSFYHLLIHSNIFMEHLLCSGYSASVGDPVVHSAQCQLLLSYGQLKQLFQCSTAGTMAGKVCGGSTWLSLHVFRKDFSRRNYI